KTNLMVFITPHILNNRAEADRVSSYKRQEQINEARSRHNETRLWPQPNAPEGREEEFRIIDKK
ncbi:MAG: hypothetical protein HY042_05115, partial [Spirochaetia bacterium]|nr:hypothetical protein [Spirochaetia bacterium]